MDKIGAATRSPAVMAGIENLPCEVFQHILHYLPVRKTRDTFRRLNKAYHANTDYLRIAGLVQLRIGARVAAEKEQQALSRFNGLMNDCMDMRLPGAMKASLIMSLADTLAWLPTACRAGAMRDMLSLCSALGRESGLEVVRRCMQRCILAYQRSSDVDGRLSKFQPMNDEEACIAADHFVADLDPTMVPCEQIINHLDDLLGAMDWANDVDSLEERGCLLSLMSDHCTSMFAMLNAAPDSLRKDPRWALVPQIGTRFARKALLLIPMQTISCQAALISVVLDLSLQERTLIRHAELDAQQLIRTTPDALMLASWKSVANGLCRNGVIDLLIKRAIAWPDRNCRLAMLKELAGIAWEKGAMGHMDRLCATISKIEPPDLALLKKLMEKSATGGVLERTELVTRDIIPYLKCVAPSPAQSNMIDMINAFMLVPITVEPGLKRNMRLNVLYSYFQQSYVHLLGTTVTNAAEAEAYKLIVSVISSPIAQLEFVGLSNSSPARLTSLHQSNEIITQLLRKVTTGKKGNW